MVAVLDINLFDGDIPKAVETILEFCNAEDKKNRLISATGAHGIVTAYEDLNFKQVLDSFYMNLPDGMPGVWISRFKGAKHIERCYGPDFFKEMIVASKDREIRHYFCGGKEGVAVELKEVCEEKFGNQYVVGVNSPPFRELTEEEMLWLANDISSKNVDVVWIGLGTPKQEFFASRLSKHTNVHAICTVGAAFDFHTDRLKQAPGKIQKMGLEWFFRLVVEPKRLWRRYIKIVPLFIAWNIIDLWKFYFNSIKE
jgi:N-acetylglucosaminyldiphosphoundecaprenol N-acetyl-beta-D-mannosaminyltransferase